MVLSRVYKEVVTEDDEKIIIKYLSIRELFGLKRMYGSLSNKTKLFFHPPELSQKKLNSTRIKAKLVLFLSTIPLIDLLRLKILQSRVILPIIAIDKNKEVIAYASLTITDKLKKGYSADFGICVKENYQRKRIGYHLINCLMDITKKYHITKINLMVDIRNKKAIRLYKKSGFIIEKKVDDGDFWNGKYISVYEMSKMLE